jgi:hypothetical protein
MLALLEEENPVHEYRARAPDQQTSGGQEGEGRTVEGRPDD